MSEEEKGAHPQAGEASGPTNPLEMQALQTSLMQITQKRAAKDKYVFWETQPVAQFSDEAIPVEDGPIDKPKTVDEVKQEPYALPDSFEWCQCDFASQATVDEVYSLLCNNYVEDDDNMFSAVPAHIRVRESTVQMVEINFLCVHKKLRHKRLAPVLIKEITRRVNLKDIWQASYTAGVLIPRPISTARYWHRSINPKKLIDIGFSRLAPRMTMPRTLKLYKLPDTAATPNLRPLEAKDAAQVTVLLNEYLAQFAVAPVFSVEEVKHWVIDAYVVDDGKDGKITDMVSFYTLPSTILGHAEHNELKAAYSYYTVPGKYPLKQLVNDAMIMARNKGYDVFNALNLMQNGDILKELKFGIGDGNLHYYLYNWRVAGSLAPSEVGLVLM
eukprot:gene10418-8368_t